MIYCCHNIKLIKKNLEIDSRLKDSLIFDWPASNHSKQDDWSDVSDRSMEIINERKEIVYDDTKKSPKFTTGSHNKVIKCKTSMNTLVFIAKGHLH